jgi:hypothetical protein
MAPLFFGELVYFTQLYGLNLVKRAICLSYNIVDFNCNFSWLT